MDLVALLVDLREPLFQVVLSHELWRPRVGDVHDVDVLEVFVVHEDGVGVVACVPGEDAVDGVGDGGAVISGGIEVPDTLREELLDPGVRHVDERDAALAPVLAGPQIPLFWTRRSPLYCGVVTLTTCTPSPP